MINTEAMDKLFSWEQMRLLFCAAFAPILAILTPTKGFVMALIVMFAFNIFAGMRADGVAITRCKNFRWPKFRNALAEVLLYLAIIEIIHTIMYECGDASEAIVVVKAVTYIILYVYLQNAFRNLVTAYPKSVALRVIYHFIRLEFARMMPSYWQPIIERIQHHDDEILNDQTDKEEGTKDETNTDTVA